MKLLITLFFTFYAIFCSGQGKTVCVTIDDLPVVTYGIKNPDLDIEIINKLIRTFNEYKIPAIGYVNEGKLYTNGIENKSKVELLKTWTSNGYDLGNHTYSHFDYNKVADSVFFKDILKGERITRRLLATKQKQLKYFRHPFLHSGENFSKSEALRNFLAKHNYQEAPVTIDNDDYLFAKAYHDAFISKNSKKMKELGTHYVEYMEKKLIFFEQKSKELFNREIPQTLLIHASLLNADYLDDLARMFVDHGYSFVSQENVLQDKAYSQPVTSYYVKGISWIFRWGLSKGLDSHFMDGDPGIPAELGL